VCAGVQQVGLLLCACTRALAARERAQPYLSGAALLGVGRPWRPSLAQWRSWSGLRMRDEGVRTARSSCAR